MPILILAFAAAYLLDTSLQLSQALVSFVLELPASRRHEAEADHIGLLMMAQSCYDPHAAVDFWGTMQEVERRKGGAPPQFLSPHPSSKNRQAVLEGMLPEAQRLLEQNDCSATSRYIDDFKSAFGRQGEPRVGVKTATDALDDLGF